MNKKASVAELSYAKASVSELRKQKLNLEISTLKSRKGRERLDSGSV